MANEIIIDDSSLHITLFSSICSRCIHFHSESVFGKYKTCNAFPEDGIPSVIWRGENDHTKPFKGDNGIRFTPYSESKGKKQR